MTWTFIDSSNINSIAHSQADNEMYVAYNSGKTYVYENVSEDEYSRIINSHEQGKEAWSVAKDKKFRIA